MKFPTDGYMMDVFLKTGMEDVMSFDEWKERADPQHNLKLCDGWLELAWRALGDVPVSPDDRLEEGFDTPWATWEKGCRIEDVWRWFDKKHSIGVKYLMYGAREERNVLHGKSV